MRARTQNSARSGSKAPIVLDAAYLRALDKIESLPQNRSGTDKTWVEQALRSWREHYTRAVRVR